MIRYLIHRPISILMLFAGLLATGLLLIGKIPVSLLPDIEVPQIAIRVDDVNASAASLEKVVMRPMLESMSNLNRLRGVECRTADHTGMMLLTFSYGTRMDLAYIEVNEKIDRLAGLLPGEMERPKVMRINTSDIPVVRVQVIPKDNSSYTDVSALAQKILKRRLEQINGVSLVDINGQQQEMIAVEPDQQALQATGIDRDALVQAIKNANSEAGHLTVTDGLYRYFIEIKSNAGDYNAINKLPVKTANGAIVPLGKLARISVVPEQRTGYHLYNGREGLVITIQKQPSSRMTDLMPDIEATVKSFRREYPRIDFSLTQDQSFLMNAGISNLYQDLIYGGLLTIGLLFLFLGNWTMPVLMGISIPVSLILTFIFFYFFHISFNIISLSGLALGIGMLIDNAIVVINNIARKQKSGMDLQSSCVNGTNEVIIPVISQVLTTVAVYAPLILLGGMAGPLIADQSIALTISLCVSLLVAFVLTPLLYKLLSTTALGNNRPNDTFFYQWVEKKYHVMIHHILQHRSWYLIPSLLLMVPGIWLAGRMPVSSLPDIEKKESLVLIDWNDQIDVKESLRRNYDMQALIRPACVTVEAEVGIKQFLLQPDNNTMQQCELYYDCRSEREKIYTDQRLRHWLAAHYPAAMVKMIDAPNAFTKLFVNNEPYFEARFRFAGGEKPEPFAGLDKLLKEIPDQHFTVGPGRVPESEITLCLNDEKMAVYGVDKSAIENVLQQLFGTWTIATSRPFGDMKNIRLQGRGETLSEKLNNMVTGNNGTGYLLKDLVSIRYTRKSKFITSDRNGEYQSVYYAQEVPHVQALQEQIVKLAGKYGFDVGFTGTYFENSTQLHRLWIIFLIVAVLLYFILVLQYESMVLPFLVMSTIPLGITGGMFLLWCTGGTLNAMSVIGFIVILGLIVDDPILKLETLQQIEKDRRQKGYPLNGEMLEHMIHKAGEKCLKSLLLVSLTTSIAMVPVLMVGGIGNDLQKPMAIVIIGGLTIGTFFTTWFIPIAYWYYIKRKENRRHRQIMHKNEM